MSLSGVLLDVDGTLVDTTYLHAVAWSEALAQLGSPVPTSQCHACIGMASNQLMATLAPDVDEDEAVAAHRALYAQSWGHLRPLPGARDLLRALHEKGLTVVLVSSASPDELAVLREALDADAWIDAATDAGDAEQGKPAPDLIAVALEGNGLSAGDVVMVGDAVWDGRAASEAGVRFLGLTCGGTSEPALRKAGAVEVHETPLALLKGSPNLDLV